MFITKLISVFTGTISVAPCRKKLKMSSGGNSRVPSNEKSTVTNPTLTTTQTDDTTTETSTIPRVEPGTSASSGSLDSNVAESTADDSVGITESNDVVHRYEHKPLSYDSIKNSDSESLLLTGMKKDVLEALVDYLKKYYSETYITGIPAEDQILLTLVRLRHNLTFEILAYLRGIYWQNNCY